MEITLNLAAILLLGKFFFILNEIISNRRRLIFTKMLINLSLQIHSASSYHISTWKWNTIIVSTMRSIKFFNIFIRFGFIGCFTNVGLNWIPILDALEWYHPVENQLSCHDVIQLSRELLSQGNVRWNTDKKATGVIKCYWRL